MAEPVEIDTDYEDWHAVHDYMSKTLRVDGVVVTHGGIAVALRPHEGPQGINPQMLVLDLAFTVTGESPSRQPVHHDQPWHDEGIKYTEVGFHVAGAQAEPPPALKIQDVH